MQLYYFHLLDGKRVMPDAEGVRLPDLTVVQQCARMIVRDLKAEPCLRQTDWSRWQVEVRDEAGVRVLLLPFQDEQPSTVRTTPTQVPRLGPASYEPTERPLEMPDIRHFRRKTTE